VPRQNLNGIIFSTTTESQSRLPDESFNKKPNSAIKGQKKAKWLFKGRWKSQTMFVTLLFRCHKETSKLQEYYWTFFSQLRLSLACHCTVAHYWCSDDISLWDYTLWVQWCHRWHGGPSATFCTHTKVKRVAVTTKQDLTQQIFLHFKLLLISRNWPDGLVVWRMQTNCRSLHLWLVRSGHVFTCDYHICLRLRDSLAVDRSITDFKNPYMEVDIVLRAFFSLWNWDIL